jgi:hypothetical protein
LLAEQRCSRQREHRGSSLHFCRECFFPSGSLLSSVTCSSGRSLSLAHPPCWHASPPSASASHHVPNHRQVLYKWPLEDLSLSTPVGPVPTTPLDLRQIDTGGARLLEELKQATQVRPAIHPSRLPCPDNIPNATQNLRERVCVQQRDRLQMRANNLKRMNTFREVGGDRAREKTKEE